MGGRGLGDASDDFTRGLKILPTQAMRPSARAPFPPCMPTPAASRLHSQTASSAARSTVGFESRSPAVLTSDFSTASANFSPLVQSGVDGLGPDLVDVVADLEFGPDLQLVVGFGRQHIGDPLRFHFHLLSGRQRKTRYGVHPCCSSIGKSNQRIDVPCRTRFSTNFRDAHPPGCDVAGLTIDDRLH